MLRACLAFARCERICMLVADTYVLHTCAQMSKVSNVGLRPSVGTVIVTVVSGTAGVSAFSANAGDRPARTWLLATVMPPSTLFCDNLADSMWTVFLSDDENCVVYSFGGGANLV